MRAAPAFFATTIGKKVVMAATGIILFGFVIGHMIGNLQVYMGPEAMNEYAVWLREQGHGSVLWIVRGVLLLSVILHIGAAVGLARENLAARPVRYRRLDHDRSSYASRTMYWSGPIVALFVVYHLLHLTFGSVHPSFAEGDVYHNFVAGFQVMPVSILYIVAMAALGFHLYHGVWSMLQTLGLSHPRYDPLRHGFAAAVTAAVVVGNISFPVAVLLGWVR